MSSYKQNILNILSPLAALLANKNIFFAACSALTGGGGLFVGKHKKKQFECIVATTCVIGDKKLYVFGPNQCNYNNAICIRALIFEFNFNVDIAVTLHPSRIFVYDGINLPFIN